MLTSVRNLSVRNLIYLISKHALQEEEKHPVSLKTPGVFLLLA